jgi:hypothetical protein
MWRRIPTTTAVWEVRSVGGAFPDTAALTDVLELAGRAPSVANAQPWRWRVGHGRIDLHADWSRRLGDAEHNRRDVLLSCGAVLDHCIVALDAAGWCSDVRPYPDPDDADFLATITLDERHPGGGSVELAQAIVGRRADRRRFAARPIPPGTLELFHVRAARYGVTLAVVPTIRWARIGDADIALRFGGAAAVDGTGDDGVMLVLATDRDDDPNRLRAGEALSHLALSATALGFASCPLTEPLNDTRNRLALACEVFDAEAYPQALLRVGWPPQDAAPLPAVTRRPVAETTTWNPN